VFASSTDYSRLLSCKRTCGAKPRLKLLALLKLLAPLWLLQPLKLLLLVSCKLPQCPPEAMLSMLVRAVSGELTAFQSTPNSDAWLG
jgi:hypothetical protein